MDSSNKRKNKESLVLAALCGVGVTVMAFLRDMSGINKFKTAVDPKTFSEALHNLPFDALFGLIGFGCAFYYLAPKLGPKGPKIHEIGKYKVVVKSKNKSFGVVKSLELIFKEGEVVTFYCTTAKVAAMLLNDFAINQNAKLEIKTADGGECELIGKNAYAHGRIFKKSVR